MAFCTNCGQPLNEGSRFCPKCGTQVVVSEPAPVVEEPAPVLAAPVQEEPVKVAEPKTVPVAEPVIEQKAKPAPPKNYLPRAIVMSILLFPTGIAAIVHAVKSHTAYVQGQYDLAVKENELAARWCKKTVIAGIIFWAAFIFFYLILIVAALA